MLSEFNGPTIIYPRVIRPRTLIIPSSLSGREYELYAVCLGDGSDGFFRIIRRNRARGRGV